MADTATSTTVSGTLNITGTGELNGTAFGTAATQNTGTSGGTLGLLNGNLTFGGQDTFSPTVSSGGLNAGLLTIGGSITAGTAADALNISTIVEPTSSDARGLYLTTQLEPVASGFSFGMYLKPDLIGSATSASFVGINTGLYLDSTYTGSISPPYGAFDFEGGDIVNNSSAAPPPVFYQFYAGGGGSAYSGLTSGSYSAYSGLTSGSYNVRGLYVGTFSAAAGTGETLNQTGVLINMPSGSSVGTSDFGIFIQGSCPAVSASCAAINDPGTAPVIIGGPITASGANSFSGANLFSAANSFTSTNTFGSGTAYSAGGTSEDLQMSGTTGVQTTFGLSSFATGTNAAAIIKTFKSVSGTVGTLSAVSSGNQLFDIDVYGDDGSTAGGVEAATEIVGVCNTVSMGVMPGCHGWGTANSSGSMKAAFEIDDAQNFCYGQETGVCSASKILIDSSGDVTPQGYLVVNGTTAPTINAATLDAWASSTLGGIYGGDGSTNDFTGINKSKATVFGIPTGTTTLALNTTTYASCTALTTNASAVIGCTTSDARVKRDEGVVVPASADMPALHKFEFLPGYGPSGVHYGWFAQDVQLMYPELVHRGPKTPLTPDGILQFDKNELVPLLVARLNQHREKENAAFRGQLASDEAKIAALSHADVVQESEIATLQHQVTSLLHASQGRHHRYFRRT